MQAQVEIADIIKSNGSHPAAKQIMDSSSTGGNRMIDVRARKVDLDKIEKAVSMILEAVGEDVNREGLQE